MKDMKTCLNCGTPVWKTYETVSVCEHCKFAWAIDLWGSNQHVYWKNFQGLTDNGIRVPNNLLLVIAEEEIP